MLQSGAPYTPTCTITGVNATTNLAGSATETANRCRITGDPGSGHSGDPYRQLNTAVFLPPLPGSLGLESGRNFLVGPGINNIDLSLQKSFLFDENRRLELRVDAFNALNHTQFSGVNSNLNFTSLTNLTPTNLPFDANGNFIIGNRNGFGTVNGSTRPSYSADGCEVCVLGAEDWGGPHFGTCKAEGIARRIRYVVKPPTAVDFLPRSVLFVSGPSYFADEIQSSGECL